MKIRTIVGLYISSRRSKKYKGIDKHVIEFNNNNENYFNNRLTIDNNGKIRYYDPNFDCEYCDDYINCNDMCVDEADEKDIITINCDYNYLEITFRNNKYSINTEKITLINENNSLSLIEITLPYNKKYDITLRVDVFNN